MAERPWRVGVDVGGTFADCVGVTPDGHVRRLKLLTNGRRRAACTPGAAPHTLLAAALPAWCVPALVGGEAVAACGSAARVVAAAPADQATAPHLPASGVGQPQRQPQPQAQPRTLLTLDAPLPATPWVDLHAPGLEAPAWGAHLLTGTPQGTPLPPLALHLSTTRGTNALLEGHVRTCGLVVNAGLEGVLAIGTQQRLGIFDLAPRKPPELAAATVGVRARLDAAGAELAPVVEADVHAAAAALRAAGVQHVAVALMHSWRNPAHEQAVAALLRQHGFLSVCTSSELSTTPRLVPRAQAAVVEARLHQPVHAYLQRVAAGLGASVLRVAASSGGVVPAAQFRAKDSLLSGPAAGCNGALAAMRAEGIQQAVTLDMGGTSTDVARLDQHGVGIRLEAEVAGVAVAAPSVDVRSVAAGGGGICVATAEGLFVGPQSAGADPGPACYGRGGPLTITDVNLLLGRLWAGAGSLPLDSAAAAAAAQEQARASGRQLEPMLRGFLEVAHEHMAAAVRTVCTHAGHDPRQHVLLAFGGAGGQHACAVAQRLGMASVLVVPDAGFVSARGALHARMEHTREAPLLEPLGTGHALHQAAHQLHRQASAGLEAMGASATTAQHARLLVALRAPGRTGVHVVDVPLDQPAHAMASAARTAYQQRLQALGDPAATLEPMVDTVRVTVAAQAEAASATHAAAVAAAEATADAAAHAAADATARATALAGTATTAPAAHHHACPVHAWASLPVGALLSGPALVVDEGATVVVEPGWTCTRTPHHALRLHAVAPPPASTNAEVDLEVAAARFIGTGAWMGICLERSAVSVNVKERLDFSCGILDPDARLVANAPHIPVHLGALGACVRAMRTRVAFDPGVLVLTNDPRCGGSHLPDLTLARAVHTADGTLLGYVAARAHHAEVGGTVPGSMPPDARSLAEEGVVIPPILVGQHGKVDERAVLAAMANGPWPSRAPDSNLADIRAAAAALDAGAHAMVQMAAELGTATLLGAMQQLMQRSAQHVRRLATALAPGGVRHAATTLDDGTPLAVTIDPRADGTLRVTVEAPQLHPRSLNAPLAVTHSAILYVLRTLAADAAGHPLDDHVAPLNEGSLLPVEISVTPGFLNPFGTPGLATAEPAQLPPVFAGNTEASQRLVDALLLALGAAANSQGTMNNLVFGNHRFSVYETMGGGAGATRNAHGVSAVHVHMSNTRLTDPETLELRHPVRLERMQLRAGSGAGQCHGGAGMVRRIGMLEPVRVNFIGQHRVVPPAGLLGGQPGAVGQQFIVRANGAVEAQPGMFAADLQAGDAVEIHTPGGGGYGAPA